MVRKRGQYSSQCVGIVRWETETAKNGTGHPPPCFSNDAMVTGRKALILLHNYS